MAHKLAKLSLASAFAAVALTAAPIAAQAHFVPWARGWDASAANGTAIRG